MSPKDLFQNNARLNDTKAVLVTVTDAYLKEVDPKIIEIIDSPEPSFWRDVTPYFTNVWLLLLTHITFQLTGKMALGAWIMYVGTPLYNAFVLDDSKNLDRKVEKKYIQS